MNEKTLSIIIPCYNESKNLEKLVNTIDGALKNLEYKVEVILVNNGSTDNTRQKIQDLLKINTNIKTVNVKKNIGYGNGILKGLSYAQNNYLGWTHADLQCDFNDCLKGFEILYPFYKNGKLNYLLKGKRINRKLLDNFFTKLMTFFIKILCKVDLQDINAQPKIFPRKLYNLFNNPPKDFLLDFYLMFLSKRYNYIALDLNVNFFKRRYGDSKGGGSFFGKIKLSVKTIYYLLKFHRKNRNILN